MGELGGEFSVEVAGHSLGGALASLFGFYASLDTRFSNNTVKVFTFGASISGKVTFAKAFHHQEAVGRLQHARFVMSEDLVPNMRFMDKDYAHGPPHRAVDQRSGRARRQLRGRHAPVRHTPQLGVLHRVRDFFEERKSGQSGTESRARNIS